MMTVIQRSILPLTVFLASIWSLPAAATDALVKEGQGRYAEKCARCHGPTMDGIEHAPALRGSEFRAAWDGKTARELYKRVISTMPQDDPGSLPEKDVIEVVAYVLSENKVTLPPVQKANDLNPIKLSMPAAGGAAR